jgi:Alpha-glutamyl/putrescinyl thymine pyrophosphorylase clade 2
MAKRSYPKLDIKTFGHHLLDSGDLDPVYLMLHQGELPPEQRDRWLVAYWCLYDCGAASYISEFEDKAFWIALMTAAVNEAPTPLGGRWPRGHERRHFRGQQGIDAVKELMTKYSGPEEMVNYVSHGHFQPHVRVKFSEVAERVRSHRGFGPWMAFKVCDMLDRLGIRTVDFAQADVFMFEDPAKAAEMLYRQHAGLPETAKVKREIIIPQVVKHLCEAFSEHYAPPLGDRPVGLQEVETVLCKYKSHLNGHYPLNNDIDEIRAGLGEWSRISETARHLLLHIPGGPGL